MPDSRATRDAGRTEDTADAGGGRAVDVATLGGGCFWCLDEIFRQLRGVVRVESGYAGGHADRPTYQQVCTGTTGHAEVVQVTFDPSVISYGDLLDVFFTIHDPTTVDRQGGDVGPQYRSVIFYHSPEQQATAEQTMRSVEASRLWGRPLVTQLVPFERFHSAESYHQDYYRRNPQQPYCQVVIEPKVAKFRKRFLDRLSR